MGTTTSYTEKTEMLPIVYTAVIRQDGPWWIDGLKKFPA